MLDTPETQSGDISHREGLIVGSVGGYHSQGNNKDAQNKTENKSSSLRVKVLKTNLNSDWETLGVGLVDYSLITKEKDPKIFVVSEEDFSTVLDDPILESYCYVVEQDTILSWSINDGTYYALSFEDTSSCEAIRDIVQSYVKKCCGISAEKIDDIMKSEYFTHEDLKYIIMAYTKIIDPEFKAKLSSDLVKNNFILKMNKGMEILEGDDSPCKPLAPELFVLFCNTRDIDTILKATECEGYINFIKLFNQNFQDEYIDKIDILQSTSKDIDSRTIKDAINMAVRILKLKRLYKNAKVLYLFIRAEYMSFKVNVHYEEEVLSKKITDDLELGMSLLEVLTGGQDPSFNALIDSIYLIWENLIKVSLITPIINAVTSSYENENYSLVAKKFLRFLTKNLGSSNLKVRKVTILLAQEIINRDPQVIKENYSLDTSVEHDLDFINALISQFTTETNCALQIQMSRLILKLSFLPVRREALGVIGTTLGENNELLDGFVYVFYNHYISKLYDLFISCGLKKTLNEEELSENIEIVVNFLCDFILITLDQDMRSRMRALYFFTSNVKIIQGLSYLISYKKTHIQTASLLALGEILATNTPNAIRTVVQDEILKPIIPMFIESSKVKNIFYSACLNFFETIKHENIAPAIEYFATKIMEDYPELKEIKAISSLILKNEQNNEKVPELIPYEEEGIQHDSRSRFDELKYKDIPDPDEEEYFSAYDDDDDSLGVRDEGDNPTEEKAHENDTLEKGLTDSKGNYTEIEYLCKRPRLDDTRDENQ